MFFRRKLVLEGKSALITGGAMGMGYSLAGMLLKEGVRVAIVDIREQQLNKAREDLSGRGEVKAYVCDVSDRNSIYSLRDQVEKDYGAIDILANVAGVVSSSPIVEKPDHVIEKTVAVNLLGIIWTTKAFLPGMIKKGEGHVVNFASAGGLLGVPYISDYCATKFGVVGFTESLRQEMKLRGHHGIHFCYVCPNTVATGMFDGATPVKGTKMLTAEDVTSKVVDGIKNRRAMIGVPASVYLLPVIKGVLPVPIMDFICRILGIATSSEHMIGRKNSF